MKVINMFNVCTGEIEPVSPHISELLYWFKIYDGWQPQYDIDNEYIGYKRPSGVFVDKSICR